jgi:hypothetical protein
LQRASLLGIPVKVLRGRCHEAERTRRHEVVAGFSARLCARRHRHEQ